MRLRLTALMRMCPAAASLLRRLTARPRESLSSVVVFSVLTLFLECARQLSISQHSIETCLGYVEIFNIEFITYLQFSQWRSF